MKVGKQVLLTLAVLAILFGSSSAMGRELRTDPVTKRVRVLYIGDTYRRTWRDLANDPFLGVSPVPASIGGFQMELIRKSMRLYLPRTYSSYEGGVDLLVLSDCDHYLFTPEQLSMFKDGVIEGGQGIIMAGGFEAFGGLNWGTTWKGSSVEDVLPVESLTHQAWNYVVFLGRPPGPAQNHPFITSLPWDTMPPFLGMNKVVPKPGSVVLFESISLSVTMRDGEPVLVYGEVGRGSGVAHAPDWNPRWGEEVMDNWEYYGDYLVNLAYLAVGLSIPQDLQLSHLVRTELAGYFLQKTVALSLLEFADMFGGNTAPLEEVLGAVEELKSRADEHYLNQEYDSVLDIMGQITDRLTSLADDAIKIKDQALFWVYTIEWIAVSATLMTCGSAIWTLMIRRKAYREVRTTRLH